MKVEAGLSSQEQREVQLRVLASDLSKINSQFDMMGLVETMMVSHPWVNWGVTSGEDGVALIISVKLGETGMADQRVSSIKYTYDKADKTGFLTFHDESSLDEEDWWDEDHNGVEIFAVRAGGNRVTFSGYKPSFPLGENGYFFNLWINRDGKIEREDAEEKLFEQLVTDLSNRAEIDVRAVNKALGR